LIKVGARVGSKVKAGRKKGLQEEVKQCCGSVTSDPAIFVIDLQDANKNQLFFCFLPYFLKVHLHPFSNIKGHKEVTKQ
jgi:hypothetical protein